MGNKETCLGRNKSLPNSQAQLGTTIKKFCPVTVNQQKKNKFLYLYDVQILCQVASVIDQRYKRENIQPDPYSRFLTRKINLLQLIFQNLEQLSPYYNLREVYTDYGFIRCLLMLNNLNIQKCIECVLEDVTFKTCIRSEFTQEEGVLLRQMFYLAGEDFNKSLCLLVKINHNRGKLKQTTVFQYLINFLETFWYDIAKKNSMHYELQILIDCGQLDLDTKFLQFLLELTLRHYSLAITKIYIVNINLGMISSETSAILGHPLMQQFVYAFGADYKQYLPRYLKKTTLLKEYGGHFSEQRMIPLTSEEARQTNF